MNAYDLDSILKLSFDEHRVHATLVVAPTESPGSVTPEMVTAYLEGQGIKRRSMHTEAIADLCAQVAADPSTQHRCEVATGTEPVDASAPELVLDDTLKALIERAEKHKLDAQNADKQPDTNQRIDFYEMSSIVVVDRGQRLARIERATDPVDGVDVLGQSIPAADSASFDGIDEESIVVRGDECFARISGEIVVGAHRLKINQTLEVRGDVDFSTGRIDFPGDVCIHGSIQDKFSVRAGGALEIRSLVGCADIESTGPITLSRGMAGKGKGRITAWNDLIAGYLEGVEANVAGDLRVRGEITNCRVRVEGELDAGNASIRSGEIVAAKGVQVGTIGSEQGIETVLVLGTIPAIETLTRKADELTDKLQGIISEREKKLETFKAAIGKANASQIEERMAMEFEINEFRSRRDTLTGAHGNLVEMLTRHASCSLTVKRAIHAKSVVYLPGYRCSFDRDIVGESRITLDRKGIPVIEFRGETKPLKEMARVVKDDRILAIEPQKASKAA